MIKEAHKKFLLEEAHADAARHSGRDLYQHLAGTHDLLEKWGADDDLCAAGLFHSVYGTRRFRHQSWPLARREVIAGLIGPRAENLVYLFCVINRPRALLGADLSGSLHEGYRAFDYHRGHVTYFTPQTRRELLELEAANLLEQKGGLLWLVPLLSADISEAAKDDIRAYIRRRREDNHGQDVGAAGRPVV